METDADPVISVSVDVEKSGDITLDLPISDLELLNKPSDKRLVFTPGDKITISVHADPGAEDAGMITAAQIKASIDLTECGTEGNYELPVQITLPEGFELSGEVTLKVSSTSAQTEEQAAGA